MDGDTASDGAWLGLRLYDTQGNRDAVGASIGVERGDGTTTWRRVTTGGSYLSASDIRTHVGLGDAAGPVTVTVVWPDGTPERWTGIEINGYRLLARGNGSAPGD